MEMKRLVFSYGTLQDEDVRRTSRLGLARRAKRQMFAFPLFRTTAPIGHKRAPMAHSSGRGELRRVATMDAGSSLQQQRPA